MVESLITHILHPGNVTQFSTFASDRTCLSHVVNTPIKTGDDIGLRAEHSPQQLKYTFYEPR